MRRFEVATDDGLAGGYMLIDPDLSNPDEIAIRLCFVDEEHVTVFVLEDALRDHLRGSLPWVVALSGDALMFDVFEDTLEVSLNAQGGPLGHVIEHGECLEYLAQICGLVSNV